MKQNTKQNKRLRKDDSVVVIAGNFRGMVGKILTRTDETATIQGINVRKKHIKSRSQTEPGRIQEIERPIHISNVRLNDGENKPVKLRAHINKKGEKELFFKKGKNNTPHRTVAKS